MTEEKNKPFYIKFKPSLMEKVEDLIEVANSGNSNKPKLTKAGFFNELLSDYFENKVVTKEFIVPEDVFYFDLEELLKEGTITATNNVPSSNFENYNIVNKIPNNLDSFNPEFNSYCYNNTLELHKGLFIFYLFSSEAIPIPLVFNYNRKEEELIITYVKPEDLDFLIESEEDVPIIEDIIECLKVNVKLYNNKDSYESEEEYFSTINFMSGISEVISNFKSKKMIELLTKHDVDTFKNSSEVDPEIAELPVITVRKNPPKF